MRKLIAVLVPMAAILAICAGTYEPTTYKYSKSGAGAGIKIHARLAENGDAPEVRVIADVGFDIAVAASAMLSNRYIWHDNGIDWGANVASDTTDAEDGGKHILSGYMGGTGWEGDTVTVNVRIYHDATAIYDTTATLLLDAPGDLKTALWHIERGYLDAAVTAEYIPALADSDKVFDLCLIGSTDGAATNVRYAYFHQSTPTVPYQSANYYSSATRDVNDGSYNNPSRQIILWYNMGFIPTTSEVLYSKLMMVSNGNDVNLSTGQYLTARLDTLTADLPWISAPQRAYDKLQRGTAWNEPDTTAAGNWSPLLTARDDGFDWGPRAGKGTVGDGSVEYPSNTTMVLDTKAADQAYLDMGASRVNAGYWLIRRSAVSAEHGYVIDLGPGAASNSQPVKVMQWVEGGNRAFPWGIGSHRVPVVFIGDDSYDEQADWITAVGVADFTMSVNCAWIDGCSGAHAGNMTTAEIAAYRALGMDIVPHGVQHSVPLGAMLSADSLYTYGTRRDWIGTEFSIADTTDVELKDFVYWGNTGIDARIMSAKWLIENKYRSAVGYGGTVVEGRLGSMVPFSWNYYINAFHIYRLGLGDVNSTSLADAKEDVGRLIDDAHDNYLAPVILWAHYDADVSVEEVGWIADAVQDRPCAVQMTLEELVSLRLAGQSNVQPSHTAAENTYMPAPAGIDSVWARTGTWMHSVWFPPFED